MKYFVKITETLEKVVPVKADNVNEALKIVKEQYRNEQIILTADDYKSTEFTEE